jgi:hypothetical protein
MISKTFASAVCLGLCALITFASSETADRSPIAAGRGAAPATEATLPIVEPWDGVAVQASSPQFADFATSVSDTCSDSIANCGDPVKHLGTQNGCACFACAYGTPSQRSVCTRSPADKDALFRRAR